MSRRTFGVSVIAAAALGAALTMVLAWPTQTRARGAPLLIVHGEDNLAAVRPEGCEEYDTPDGVHSARVSGEVLQNNGDDALIISTDFRVFVGELSWDSTQESRVFVGDSVRDVRLMKEGIVAQAIPRGVTRCMLFVERIQTFVPPAVGPPPHGPGARIGTAYAYSVRTHCGVTIMESTDGGGKCHRRSRVTLTTRRPAGMIRSRERSSFSQRIEPSSTPLTAR